MKLVLEISSMGSGSFTYEDKEVKWVRLAGTDKEGRFSVAKAKGYLAEGIVRDIGKLLMPGEEISNRRFIVDLTGEWREDKPRERDGRTYRNRYFHVASFNILHGPILELTRIRRETSDAVSSALEMYKNGDVHSAFRALVEHSSRIAGVPVDIQQLERMVDEMDELEFGITDNAGQQSPEAIAAAKFAALDRVDNPQNPATAEAEVQTTEALELSRAEPVEEPVHEYASQEPRESTDEPVDGTREENDGEEPESSDEDVLDHSDEPEESRQSEEQTAEELKAPKSATRMGSPFGRPFGSPTGLGRPGM